MKRRDLLKALPLSVASYPSNNARAAPKIQWRLVSSFPKSLNITFGAAKVFAENLSALTDGNFSVQLFAAGEVVPALQAIDAVQNGAVEACQSPGFYNQGKDLTWALGTGVPFGFNTDGLNAWLYEGGGQGLYNEYVGKYGLISFPAGNTGPRMGAWFRKEISTIDDLRGLKIRIGGLAGQILQRLGAVPVQIPGAELYQALESGAIDAVEWISPYDDEKLGFGRIAPYYYYPGLAGNAMMGHFFVSHEKFQQLPHSYQIAFDIAAKASAAHSLYSYDAKNPDALKRILGAGAQLRLFSPEILQACFDAAQIFYREQCERNLEFAKIWSSLASFRKKYWEWQQVAGQAADHFMIQQLHAGRL
ncbi:TRAP transporter substrate-binding protein [Mesorhizobium sp. NPDC059054]|uniref:TRAP transporter substrate-binding protein n=1 Tax=Mesorhizobium sp. NPDC059054 TaxID=3346711 RepID=UPI0036B02C1D